MQLAELLLKDLPPRSGWEALPADDRERLKITELLWHLVEFHRRESKPVFWAKYERSEMTEEELYEDINCPATLERVGEPETVKQSLRFHYKFYTEQDTKISKGKKVFLAENIAVAPTIDEMDTDNGTVTLKISRRQLSDKLEAAELPARIS